MASILVAIMSELVEAGARASWRLASMAAAAEAERVGAIVRRDSLQLTGVAKEQARLGRDVDWAGGDF